MPKWDCNDVGGPGFVAMSGPSKNPEPFQMVFPHVIVKIILYHVPKCWLPTLTKEFILCFLCGMSAYNHQVYSCFRENHGSKLEWCHEMCKAYSVFPWTDMESNHSIESTERWLKSNGSCWENPKQNINLQKWAVSHTDHLTVYSKCGFANK